MINVEYGNDSSGGFYYYGDHERYGCGVGPLPSGFIITLKDPIPWTRITVKFETYGHFPCWTFMYNRWQNGWDLSDIEVSTNILDYNASLGDRIFYDDTAFGYSPALQRKLLACDGDSNNTFISENNPNIVRSFYVMVRRDSLSTLASIAHNRDCGMTGSGVYTRVSNIFVW
jgi:hypothetical protein